MTKHKETKKQRQTKSVKNMTIDDFVNEAKNIDFQKVEQIIGESKKEEKELSATITTASTEECETHIEETTESKEEKVTEQTSIVETKIDIENTLVEETETQEEVVEAIEDTSIDDVIAECVGTVEEKVQETKSEEFIKTEDKVTEDTEDKFQKENKVKKTEPWYIARARRINDYYNW